MPEKSFKIKFIGADFASKMLAQPPAEIFTNPQPQDFNFDFLVDIKVDAPRKTAIVLTDISIVDKNKTKIFANFKTICAFELEDFDKSFNRIGENQYDLDIDLEIILKATGISTTRGMIIPEVKGSYLHGAILPLIDIASLIKSQRSEKGKQKTEQ